MQRIAIPEDVFPQLIWPRESREGKAGIQDVPRVDSSELLSGHEALPVFDVLPDLHEVRPTNSTLSKPLQEGKER